MELSTDFEEGEGNPLVLLHGWLGSMESWKQVRGRLELPNPILFYDQRCHGKSECEEFDFGDLADDLHNLVEQHGLEEPVLVAHSMGGMVALTYAAEYDNLGGLLLVGTCASTPEPGLESPLFYLKNFRSMDRREWSEMIADNYLGDRNLGLREGTVKELMDADEEPVVYGLESMIQYDVREHLASVDVPVKVVGATHDRAITPEKVEELAELLDAPLEMLDSSHLMLQEVPELVALKTEEFAGRLRDQ